MLAMCRDDDHSVGRSIVRVLWTRTTSTRRSSSRTQSTVSGGTSNRNNPSVTGLPAHDGLPLGSESTLAVAAVTSAQSSAASQSQVTSSNAS